MQPEDIPDPKSTDYYALFQKEAINQLLSLVACSMCFVPGHERSGRGKVHGPLWQGQTCFWSLWRSFAGGLPVWAGWRVQTAWDSIWREYQRSHGIQVNLQSTLNSWCSTMNKPCSISKASYHQKDFNRNDRLSYMQQNSSYDNKSKERSFSYQEDRSFSSIKMISIKVVSYLIYPKRFLTVMNPKKSLFPQRRSFLFYQEDDFKRRD